MLEPMAVRGDDLRSRSVDTASTSRQQLSRVGWSPLPSPTLHTSFTVSPDWPRLEGSSRNTTSTGESRLRAYPGARAPQQAQRGSTGSAAQVTSMKSHLPFRARQAESTAKPAYACTWRSSVLMVSWMVVAVSHDRKTHSKPLAAIR